MEISIFKLKNGFDIIGEVERNDDKIVLYKPFYITWQITNEGYRYSLIPINYPYGKNNLDFLDITDEVFYEYIYIQKEFKNKYKEKSSGIILPSNEILKK